MTGNEFSIRLKELMTTDIDSVFVEMESHIDKKCKVWNDIVYFKSKYNSITQDYQKNLISNSDYYLNIDKVRFSMIGLINQITDNDIEANGSIQKNKNVTVEITIDDDFESFDSEKQKLILSAIENFLKLNSTLKILNLKKGSVKITISLLEEDYEKLNKGFLEGDLIKYGIIGIRNLSGESNLPLQERFNERGQRISPVLPPSIRNFLIDIDGTICDEVPNDQPERMRIVLPYPDALAMLNRWFEEGHIITFFTERTIDQKSVTETWLSHHGFKYHGIIFGKPRGGNYHWIDNRIVRATRFNEHFAAKVNLDSRLPKHIKNFLIDIDGTICDDIPNDEPDRMRIVLPYPDALAMLNRWFEEGHIITFFTSRTLAQKEITETWLKYHGFKYHGIIFEKPRGGNYHWIDDNIVKATRFTGKFTNLIVKMRELEIVKEEQFKTNSDLKISILTDFEEYEILS